MFSSSTKRGKRGTPHTMMQGENGFPPPSSTDSTDTPPVQHSACWHTLLTLLQHAPAPPPDAPEELHTLLPPMRDLAQMLERHEHHIVFWGTFKSGKSTLLNALMGSDVVPVRVLRATGTITSIRSAPHPSVTLLRRTGERRSEEHIAFDERARHILLNLAEADAADSIHTNMDTAIEEVCIHLPLPLLQQRAVLLDTPGLMDDLALTRRTYQALRHADLAIMVLSAYQLLSLKEKEAASMVQRMLQGNIIFIINQMDLVAAEEREAVQERARMVLQGVGNALVGQPRIFTIAALHALEARKRGDTHERAHTSLRTFERWLTALLAAPAWEAAVLHSRLERLERHLQRLSNHAHQHAQQAQAHLAAAHSAAAATHARQQIARREAIVEDRQRLEICRQRLATHDNTFISACVSHAVRIMHTDADWHLSLPTCFEQGVQRYAQRIRHCIKAALVKSGIAAPALRFEQPPGHPARLATEAWHTSAGMWVALLPDIPLAQRPQPPDAALPLDDLLDAWLQQAMRGIIPLMSDAVAQSARAALPALHQAATSALDRVVARLDEQEQALAAQDGRVPHTPDIAAAQQRADDAEALQAWCDSVQQALAAVREQCPTATPHPQKPLTIL
jgi:ethanolamine utilization protein EutP (predicted NTPase)